jgi:hypothetical protein
VRGRTILAAAALIAASLVVAGGAGTASTPTFSFRTAQFNLPEFANDTTRNIAIGDLDGQNGNDVVVLGYGGDLSIFLNDGHGGFQPGQHISGGCTNGDAAGVAIGQFTSDTTPDLLVACTDAVNDGFLRYQGNGDGTFKDPERAAPMQAYAGENDQRQPVYEGTFITNMVHGQFGGEQSIVWNLGSCGGGCGWVLCALPDRYFATDFGPDASECSIDVDNQGEVTGGVEFYTPIVLGRFPAATQSDWAFTTAPADLGLHTGSLIGAVHGATAPPDYTGGFFSDNFEPPDAQASNIRPLAAGDLNGDGTSEIVSGYAGANEDQLAVYRLTGPDNGGTFLIPDPQLYASNPAMNSWYGGAVADFNGDGNPDVAVLGSTTTSALTDFEVFPGDGQGALGVPQAFNVTDFTTESVLAAGDLNGDGHPDLVTTIGAGEGLPARLFVMYSTPPPRLTVTKTGSGAGSVTSAPASIDCGAACSAQFDSGTQVTLTATPAAGSRFAGWSGGGCSGTGTCSVTLGADTSVAATFVATANLAVSRAGTGSGSVTSSPAGISCGATCAAVYDIGTQVILTASASGGSAFTGWSGGGCSGTGSCKVTLAADASVTAAFARLLPPGTKLVKSTIDAKKHEASFRFEATGKATGFQCALAASPAKPKFGGCRSPKSYRHLRPGKYTFEVRAVNGSLHDPTPATKKFTIGR